jgi:hypothetical protein
MRYKFSKSGLGLEFLTLLSACTCGFFFSDSYFDLNLNAVIMKLHEEVIFDLTGCHDRMVVATDLCFSGYSCV